MITEGKDEADGMDPLDDEALWNLLGRQTPPVQVSPYFARRVLREVTLAEEQRGGWWLRVRRLWTPASRHTAAWSGTIAFGVLCLSAVLTIPSNRPPVSYPAAVATTYTVDLSIPAGEALPPAAPEVEPLAETAQAQDVELIADLDNLLNREESRLWTEDDTARF